MKKQHIIRSLMALVLVLGLTACADEDIVERNGLVVEGVPVKVQIPISIPKMEVMESRGLSEMQERQMNDFYVIVFNNEKQKEAYYYFDYDPSLNQLTYKESTENQPAEINHHHGSNQPTNEKTDTYGTVTLAITSGTKYIYGFANVDDNALGKSYKNALDNVEKLDDLNGITISFYGNEDENGSDISTVALEDIAGLPTTANIPMNGAFKDSNITNEEGYCIITPNGILQTEGTIQLKRLFAKIKFIIKKGEKVTNFTLSQWQAVHLPQSSLLLSSGSDEETVSNYKKSLEKGPSNDAVDANGNKLDAKKGEYGFEYYMLENKKNKTEEVKEYGLRETPGTGDQEFLYVNNNATYIRLKGTLEMKVDNVKDLQNNNNISNGVQRYADLEYIIHLGGEDKPAGNSSPDKNDFNVLRNTSYTYEITILGVGEIETKVREQNEDEDAPDNIPGQDGRIIDMTGSGVKQDLDCHNHVFNIELTKDDKPFLFRVVTPHGNFDNIDRTGDQWTANNSINNNNTYKSGYSKDASLLTWIQFRALKEGTNDKQLAYYDPNVEWADNDHKAGEIPANLNYDHTDLNTDTYGGIHYNGVGVYNQNYEKEKTEVDYYEYGITPLMNLYELAAYVDKMELGQSRRFTVFVKEYYYETDPTVTAPTDGNSKEDWDIENWNQFVDKDNRSVILDLYTIETKDEQSTYSQGDIYITQKSIQTYYKEDIALGVEHESETGEPIYKETWADKLDVLAKSNNWYHHMAKENSTAMYINSLNEITDTNKYLTSNNGYFNQYMALLYYGIDNKWSSYLELQSLINITGDHGYNERNKEANPVIPNVPKIGNWNNFEAIVDCMARNRDENGDGIIQPDEMKWYLPASEQLNEIYLGASALERSPLFNPLTDSNNYGENNDNYHYLSSDLRNFWADEGNSTGESQQHSRRIRCVRTLGAKYPTAHEDNLDYQRAYHFNNDPNGEDNYPQLYDFDPVNNIFTFPYLNDKNFRPFPTRYGELTPKNPNKYRGAHTNFDNNMNRFFSNGFQMAKNFVRTYEIVEVDETVIDEETGEQKVDENGNPQTIRVNKVTGNYSDNGYYNSFMKGNGDPNDANSYTQYHLGENKENDADTNLMWSPCQEYSENGSDKGSWRMPNQKEVSVMAEIGNDFEYVNVRNQDDGGERGIPSITAWENGDWRIFWFHQSDNQMFLADGWQGVRLIRCVRDNDPTRSALSE